MMIHNKITPTTKVLTKTFCKHDSKESGTEGRPRDRARQETQHRFAHTPKKKNLHRKKVQEAEIGEQKGKKCSHKAYSLINKCHHGWTRKRKKERQRKPKRKRKA